tara:strand:+ start:278 stop:448 length:171 start_codon:yes stop_codon:yes gene_type:complete
MSEEEDEEKFVFVCAYFACARLTVRRFFNESKLLGHMRDEGVGVRVKKKRFRKWRG